jgi:hypothetical protein
MKVKNCKSRIAKKVFSTVWTFLSRGLMNERIFSLVIVYSAKNREIINKIISADGFSVLFLS